MTETNTDKAYFGKVSRAFERGNPSITDKEPCDGRRKLEAIKTSRTRDTAIYTAGSCEAEVGAIYDLCRAGMRVKNKDKQKETAIQEWITNPDPSEPRILLTPCSGLP